MQFKVPDDPDVYTLVKSKFTFAEARAIEKATGFTMQQVLEDPKAQNATTMQAMFWVSMKRKRPTLAFVELDDLAMDEIEFLPEDEDDQEQLEEHGGAVGPTSPVPDSDPEPAPTEPATSEPGI